MENVASSKHINQRFVLSVHLTFEPYALRSGPYASVGCISLKGATSRPNKTTPLCFYYDYLFLFEISQAGRQNASAFMTLAAAAPAARLRNNHGQKVLTDAKLCEGSSACH